MIRLLVKFKDRTIKELSLDRLDTLTIGRKSTNDLIIDNYGVSGDHAVIRRERNHYRLSDQNSKNGTFLNGLLVRQATLKNGDVITIGKHALVFLDRGRSRTRASQAGLKTSAAPGDPGPDETMFMEGEAFRRMLAESKDAQSQPAQFTYVDFLSGGSGRMELNKSLVTIGTSNQCDIVIKGFFSFLAGDPAATISKTPQHHYINAVVGWIRPKVNGRTIRGPVRLEKMDIIKVGSVVLKYECNAHENF